MADVDKKEIDPAFSDLIAYLRQQGFTIGIDHYLRLQQLLNSIAGDCAPEDLKTLLCPIFATNAKEQENFYQAFDNFYYYYKSAATEPVAESGKKDSIEQEIPRQSAKSKWSNRSILILLTIVVFAPVIVLLMWPKPT